MMCMGNKDYFRPLTYVLSLTMTLSSM